MQAAALAAMATGDRRPLDAVLARFRAESLPALVDPDGDGAPDGDLFAHAIAQPPDARALGPNDPFDAPWQMASLVLGLAAARHVDGGDDLREALLIVARRIVRHGVTTDGGLRPFVSARDPLNVAPPRRGPDGLVLGAMALPALVVAHGVADSDDDRSRFLRTADLLYGRLESDAEAIVVAERWLHLYRSQRSSRR